MVFESGVAPSDRTEFLAWYSQVMRLRDGHLGVDPRVTTPRLQAWHRDMARKFPGVSGPISSDATSGACGDYRFAEKAVVVRFDWEVSRKARYAAQKLAREHQVAFFDASGDGSPVWEVRSDGGHYLAHSGEVFSQV